MVAAPTMKKYHSASAENKDVPHEFEVDGEVFTCYPWRLSPGLYLEMTIGQISSSSRALWDSYHNILGDEPTIDPKTNEPRTRDNGLPISEYDRFHDFVTSSVRRVETETLVQILADVYVESTGRPT